jgi:hypothetical protein
MALKLKLFIDGILLLVMLIVLKDKYIDNQATAF